MLQHYTLPLLKFLHQIFDSILYLFWNCATNYLSIFAVSSLAALVIQSPAPSSNHRLLPPPSIAFIYLCFTEKSLLSISISLSYFSVNRFETTRFQIFEARSEQLTINIDFLYVLFLLSSLSSFFFFFCTESRKRRSSTCLTGPEVTSISWINIP